jgi:hypothetical protein
MEWLGQKTTLQTKLLEIGLIIKRGLIANFANICFIMHDEEAVKSIFHGVLC